MSLAHLVEARLPYLDRRVVESGLAAADDHNIRAWLTWRGLQVEAAYAECFGVIRWFDPE